MALGYVANPSQLEAAPPPPPPEVQGPNPIQHKNRRIKMTCTTVFWRLLLLCYIIWSMCLLVMQPKKPKYNVESGTVHLKLQDSQITGRWDTTVLGFNPNKYFNIQYRYVQAGLAYQIKWGDDHYTVYTLVKQPWPSSDSNKRNKTSFKFSVSQKELGWEAVQQMSNKVGVFQLRFQCKAVFVSKVLPPKSAVLQFGCYLPSDNGNITFTSQYSGKCKVKVSRNYIYEFLVGMSYIVILVCTCCSLLDRDISWLDRKS